MKAGMSDDAELFIKAEEAPVSLIDQGHSATHAVITHKCTQNGPTLALLICYVDQEQRCQRADGSLTALFFLIKF